MCKFTPNPKYVEQQLLLQNGASEVSRRGEGTESVAAVGTWYPTGTDSPCCHPRDTRA